MIFKNLIKETGNFNEIISNISEYGNDVDKIKEAINGLSDVETKLILNRAELEESTIQKVLATKADADATVKQTVAQASNMTIVDALKLKYQGLAASLGLSTAALTAFLGIAAGIAITVVAVKTFTKSLEESREELENLKTECANIASELKSVNSELDTTRKRMNELAAKGSKITFSEKEEYDNLVKANNELQRKIDLLELEEKQKNKEKNASFIENMSKDVDKKDERVLTGKLSPKGDTAETEYITETELIKRKFEELAELRIELDNATTDYQRETFQKQIENIENYLEKKNSEFAKVADEIHYIENPTTEDDKAVNKWLNYVADFQDKMAIAMGGSNAKTNAFNRIVDNWEFDNTVQELQDLGNQSKVTADMLNNQKYNEFINKLVEIGVIDSADNLSDIALAFNKVDNAVNNATDSIEDFNKLSITDTVNNINNKLKPALDSLVNTYTTLFSEEGNYEWQPINVEEFASIGEQLDSLSEEFGINVPTEDYENFVTILSDSTTTADQAQQAFDDLASSMINNSNVVELTDENFDVLRNSLENLGVVNATEVLEEMRDIQQKLANEEIDLNRVTIDQAEAFIKEAGALDIASQYLQAHMLQKHLDNANPLNTYESVQELEKECKALKITGDLLEKTAKLKSLYYAAERNLGGSGIQKEIDKTKSEIDNLINNQYSYKFDFDFDGNLNGGGSGSGSSSKDTKETFDWIETLISRIQRNITNLGKVVSATYRNWSTRNNALAQEMGEVNKEISAQMTAYNAYMAEANSIPLAEGYKELVRSGSYDISTITDEKLKEQIQEYEEWYNKALSCSDAIEDLRANLAELAMTKFNNVSEQYDEQISLITHNVSMLEGFVSQSEAAGYMASEVYYKAMSEKQQENISQLQGEYASLLSAFDEAVKNGSIEKYSSDWYDMVSAINDVELELQDATTQLVEFNQTLQQLSWESFDRVQGYVSNIVTESEHLVDILDAYDLHTDKGIITEEGLAVQGLYAVNYNTYMEQALAYANEMAKIEEEMAKDPYDMELIDRRNELLGLQQESIQNAMSEKEAIRDLVSDGYDKMLNSLDELINKRKEALQAEKDMYDYQNSISEKTNNIASLKKQLQAYSGDNSESAKATIQKLQVSLGEAEKDLQETEYEKYLSDQEQMLDALYDQTEQWVNERLDNLDGLVAEAVDATNKNAETISNAIHEAANAYGYKLSDQMETILDYEENAIDGVCTIVSVYGDVLHGTGEELIKTNTNITSAINGGTTNVINAINGLNVSMQNMINALNNMATTNKNSIAQAQNTVTNGQNGSYGGNHSANDYNVSTGGSSDGSNNGGSNNNTGDFKKTEASKTPKGYYAYIGDEKVGHSQGFANEGMARYAAELEVERRAKAASSGVSGSPAVQIYNNTKSALTRQIKTLPFYASGTPSAKSGWGVFGEDGNEIMIAKDGSILLASGATLYPFQGGEPVFNAKDTSEILNSNLTPLSINDFSKASPNMNGIVRNTGGDVNQDINVNFSLPNVTDANSLINELQHDKRFEKIIQSMTADRMLGKNSLNKYKF